MSYQLTLRIDDDLNERAIEQANILGLTRAGLIRRALNSYLDKSNPNGDSEIIEILKKELTKAHELIQSANEARERSDIICMELTQQIKQQQKQLTKPTTLWRKLCTVFN